MGIILNTLARILQKQEIQNKPKVETQKSKEEIFAQRVNSLPTDVDRILAFESLKGQQKAFIIIDKSKSQAQIYKGKEIVDTVEVGVGADYGDDLNTMEYKNGQIVGDRKTTPSGLYYAKPQNPQLNYVDNDKYTTDNVLNCFILHGIQHPVENSNTGHLAIHQLPNDLAVERSTLFSNQGSRRSMSTGCVNVQSKDFQRIAKNINSNGTPVYVLPEEKDNSLEVVSLPNGLYMKTHYGDEQKENILQKALKSFFKLN